MLTERQMESLKVSEVWLKDEIAKKYAYLDTIPNHSPNHIAYSRIANFQSRLIRVQRMLKTGREC